MNIADPDFVRRVAGLPSRVALWEDIVTAVRASTFLEVGVWRGEFAREILSRCDGVTRYYMIDPWAHLPDWNKPLNVPAETFDAVFAEAMAATAFADARRIVLRGRTKEVIDRIPDGSLDVAYIDGDHTLRGITVDLIRILPKVRNGGLIGGDDFVSTPWQHDLRYEPTLVCPWSVYFAEAHDLPILALPWNQFVLQKRPEAGFVFLDPTNQYGDLALNKRPPKRFWRNPFTRAARRR